MPQHRPRYRSPKQVVGGRSVEDQNPRCDDSGVALRASGGGHEEAVLDGGPMDGYRQAVEAETDQLCVVMSDGQQHQYLRTEEVWTEQDGRTALVFRWTRRTGIVQ